MNSIFDKTISVYDTAFDNVGKEQLLSDFLFDGTHQEEIMRIRATEDKATRSMLKRQLPCATVSSRFLPSRSACNLTEHSGFICLDIDGQDNPNITDFDELKRQLSVIPQIAYAGLSVSGKGLFLLVPIQYPSCHMQHFLQLVDDFDKMGIKLDRNCSDVCRCRVKSYDANQYVNENALTYNKVKVIERPRVVFHADFSADDTLNQVSQLCEIIDRRGIDITATYQDWVKVGFALASLGEHGRRFFHVCSRQNEKYRQSETDRKFDNLLKSNGSISIATFFKICKDYGISLYQ